MRFLRSLVEGFWDDMSANNMAPRQPQQNNSTALDKLKRHVHWKRGELANASDQELIELVDAVEQMWDSVREQGNRLGRTAARFFKKHMNSPAIEVFTGFNAPDDAIHIPYPVSRVTGVNEVKIQPNTTEHAEFQRILVRIRRLEALEELQDEYRHAVMTERDNRKKQARGKARQKSGAWIAQQQQNNTNTKPSSNPPQLTFKPSKSKSGKSFRMDNPFHKDRSGGKDQFVGHPAYYQSWTPQMLAMYYQISQQLAAEGRPPLKTMYAGRQNSISFVVVADDNFVWRKYDPSPGAGQNWVYVDGKKMNTSNWLK